MSLIVHTGRVSYRGADRLDITRKSAPEWALAFAPSWGILRPALAARRRSDAIRTAPFLRGEAPSDYELEVAVNEALRVEDEAWMLYTRAFVTEMRRSYVERRADWDRLLVMSEVVLVCYCTDYERCHRTLLARDLLPRLGATYRGERRA